MPAVGIVTDSTSCLPRQLVDEYGIRVVPIGLVLDGKPCRDQVDIAAAEFYRLLPDLKELPTTTAVTPGDFVEAFRDLAGVTDSIACILVSGALSGTPESAREARELFKTEFPNVAVEIVDSRTSAGALGLIVLEAARASQSGKSLSEVLEIVEWMLPRVKYIGALDTLRYLIKGGRAPKTAYIGELLQVKPIIGLVGDAGLVDSLGKARTKRKAFEKIIELAQGHVHDGRPVHAIVHYSHRPEDGERLKGMVSARLKCAELFVSELTPTMCCHTGPAAGISFYCDGDRP